MPRFFRAPFSTMRNFLRVLVAPLLAAAVCQSLPAQGARNIGEVRVDVNNAAIAVRVTASSPDLQALAQSAFNAHGRYRVVASGHAFEFRFSPAGANQVKVDIARASGAAVHSQVVAGNSPRQALLKAADVAVEKTNGLGLKGFFTARLAFVSKRSGRSEVYTSDLFLGEAKQLTRDGAHVLTPRWSPDGARVVYTSFFRSNAPDVFASNVTTGARETLISFRGTNSGARFSPSGQQLAVIMTGEGAPDLYVTNSQGRAPSRKTRSDAVKSSPCWSPDGSQIVFTMEPGPQLYLMSAAGGAPRRLALGVSTYAAEPDWCRTDRNKIACTVRVGRQYQIAVYDFAAGAAKVVSKASFDGVEPSWLADGRHLVYTARDRSSSFLCILDTETGNSTRLGGVDSQAMQANVWTP
jgi:TolB protein